MAETPAGTAGTLRLERRFAARRERVYRAFTDASELARWYAPGEAVAGLAEVDLRAGGFWRVQMRGPEGTVYRLRCAYVEVEPPVRLVFTWRWEHEEGGVETLVTLEFVESGEETLVRVTHSGFGTEAEQAGHAEGWAGAFEKLERML